MKKERKKRKWPPLTSYQVLKAFEYWVRGERMEDIARRYDVSVQALYNATREIRESTGQRPTAPRKRKPAFSPRVINKIFQRWQNGESLSDISREYGVAHTTLYQATAALRAGKAPHMRGRSAKALSASQITDAAERWQNGESLTDIAREYHVSHTTVYRETKALRDGKPPQKFCRRTATRLSNAPVNEEAPH